MRKIKTKEEIEKESKRNQMIVGGVLIFLLIVSILGYGALNQDNEDKLKEEYNGVEFVKQQGRWYSEIGGEVFSFQYLPKEVENISVSGNFNLENYKGKVLYFVNNNEGVNEILNNLDRYVLRKQKACLAGQNCSENLPVKTCEDNLIIFESEGNGVWQEENCAYISGSIKEADAFLYNVFEII